MLRFPKYTFRLGLAILLAAALFFLALMPGYLSSVHHPLLLGGDNFMHFWVGAGKLGMQHHEWLNPPRPIIITDPSKQVSGLRWLVMSSNNALIHYSKWEEGFEDRSVTPPAFSPVGYVTQEWYFSLYWLVLLSLLPAAYYLWKWLPSLRAHQRLRQNLCPKCAYDLRAHEPGAKCPECGTPRAAPPQRPVS